MRFHKAMSELIQIRIAPAEKRQLRKVARARGVTLSDFVRQAVTEATRQGVA